MSLTIYGRLQLLSDRSTRNLPSNRNDQTTLYVGGDQKTDNEVQTLIRREWATKTYLPNPIRTFVLLMHVTYWTAGFIRWLERNLPPTITQTFVTLVQPNEFDLTFRYRNTLGSLDGIDRGSEDQTFPLHVGCSLTIALDVLVNNKENVIAFIRLSGPLQSFIVVPPVNPVALLETTCLPAVLQIIMILDLNVDVDVYSAFPWTQGAIMAIQSRLNRRN